MASYDSELISAARRLLVRKTGQRGKLPSARVRRSISTSYYALFHFVLDEVGAKIVGTRGELRVRRRIVARSVSHQGAKQAFSRVKGDVIETAFQDYFGLGNTSAPRFARQVALAFVDAQAKRHDADYDMNKPFTETDARLLSMRVRRVIAGWRAAKTPRDRDFKQALSLLILLNGKLRTDS